MILNSFNSQAHDDEVNLFGAGTGPANYREIRTALEINSDGTYLGMAHFEDTGGNVNFAFFLNENYARLTSIGVSRTVNGASSTFHFRSGMTDNFFTKCRAKDIENIGAGGAIAFFMVGTGSMAFACISENLSSAGLSEQFRMGNATNAAVECGTFTISAGATRTGFVGAGTSSYAWSCVGADSNGSDFEDVSNQWNGTDAEWNASKDNTSDLGTAATNFANGVDLVGDGDLDADFLATATFGHGRTVQVFAANVSNMGGILTGPQTDISGRLRPSGDVTQDVGASQFVAVVAGIVPILEHHYRMTRN